MAALDVLARLAKQAVDQERQALQRINVAIAGVEQRVEALGAMSRAEAGYGADFMTVGATLPAFQQANKLRLQAAGDHLQKLQIIHAEQLQKLQQQRIELKRYELLAERRQKRLAEELAVKERKAIDDLVLIKAGRRPAGG